MPDDYKDWQDQIFQEMDEMARLERQRRKELETLIEKAASIAP